MMPHIKDFQNVESVSIRFAQKVSIIVFLILFLISGLLVGKEAVAQSDFGPQVATSNETNGAKADFLFKQPTHYFGLHLGRLFPTADSDLFDMVTSVLTLEKSDFRAWNLAFDFGFNLLERVDLVFRLDYADRTKDSEFRDYVDQQGLPIRQKTNFMQTSVTVGIKYLFVPRGSGVGRYAWFPNRLVPFVETGVGGLNYRFRQSGDFVDYQTMEIFRAHLESSGWTPTVYLGGGVDVHLYRSSYLTMDLKYSWAEHDLSKSFSDFDPIDLSGFRTTAGISFHF